MSRRGRESSTPKYAPRARPVPPAAAVLWAGAFIIYQTTFLCAPRLLLFPEAGMAPADIPEYAAALRGRPNETDMRKHLLYYPLSRGLYRIADAARLRLGACGDGLAQVFPGALCGATSVALAYMLFLRLVGDRRPAAAAAACYAFTYSVWIFSSVPESYALTAFSVNLFLCAVFARDGGPTRRWLGCMVALIAFSALCDARCLLLAIVPIYVIALSPGVRWTRKIGSAVFLAMGALCLVGAVYSAYGLVSGDRGFGIPALSAWLWGLGREYTSLHHALDPRVVGWVLLTFFVETLSPLHQLHMNGAAPAAKALHLSLSCGFVAAGLILLSGALRAIGKRFASCPPAQGLACCLAVYILSHIVFSPGSALHFSTPVVLPLLLLVLPGILDAWKRNRYGPLIMCALVVCLLANNLVLVNEARGAWRRAPLAQAPLDRVYLLPGEVERARFLSEKASATLTAAEKERLAVLRWRPERDLTGRERLEMERLIEKGFRALPAAEMQEAAEIIQRCRAVVRLAQQQAPAGEAGQSPRGGSAVPRFP